MEVHGYTGRHKVCTNRIKKGLLLSEKICLIVLLSAGLTIYYILHTTTWQTDSKINSHPVKGSTSGGVEKNEFLNTKTIMITESTRFQDGNLSLAKSFQEMEHRQLLRKNLTDQICSKHKIFQESVDSFLSFRGNRGALFANDQHKVIFAKIHKIASNHFTKLWKTLGGLKPLYKETRDSCVARIKKYYRVIFVRHPLSRILSAYMDKFQRHNTEHFREIARGIKRRQQANFPKRKEQENTTLAFDEFIHYLVKTNGNRRNSHWNLVSSSAKVCELRYDFIGKLESLDNDLKYLLHKLDVRGSFKMLREYNGYNGDVEKLRSYYNNISRPLLLKLYQAYKLDFDMFGYDMNILGPKIWPKH